MGGSRLACLVAVTCGSSIALAPGAGHAQASISPLGAPVTVGTNGNEPIVKSAPDGTLYISALEYLYSSADGGATWHPSPGTLLLNGSGNGGINQNTDSSIDVDPGGRLYLTFDTPYAGTTTTCYSDDKAQTLTCNPTTLPGGTDRMWLTAPSNSTAYLTSNEGLYHTFFFVSTDRGQNYSLTKSTDSPLNPNDGPPILAPHSPLIYQPFVNNASNQTATDEEMSGPVQLHVWDPTSSSSLPAAELNTPLVAGAALTDAAFTPDGTLYVVSEAPRLDSGGAVIGKTVQVIRSSDQGATWTQLPPLPGTTTGTAAFTWLAAGSDGHVGVIYYQTPVGGRADAVNGTWNAMWAETTNAEAAAPQWTTQTVEAGVHTGAMCTTAGCTGSNRFSGDFIGASFDRNDQPHLTWVREVTGGGTTTTQVRYAGAAPRVGVVAESPLPMLLALAGAGGAAAAVVTRRRRQSTTG
jgi:hypothetical protein